MVVVVDNDRTAAAGTMWLARHGESSWNAHGLVQGQAPGPVLTRRGRRQARHLARRLEPMAPSAVYSSDLDRAVQTAGMVAARLGLTVRQDVRLRERCFGVLEGTPVAGMPSSASGIADGRVVDSTARPDGGESLSDLYDRAGQFLQSLSPADQPGNIVVVTHGGTLRMLDACFRQVPVGAMGWHPVPNCHLVTHDRSASPLIEPRSTTAQPWRST